MALEKLLKNRPLMKRFKAQDSGEWKNLRFVEYNQQQGMLYGETKDKKQLEKSVDAVWFHKIDKVEGLPEVTSTYLKSGNVKFSNEPDRGHVAHVRDKK